MCALVCLVTVHVSGGECAQVHVVRMLSACNCAWVRVNVPSCVAIHV